MEICGVDMNDSNLNSSDLEKRNTNLLGKSGGFSDLSEEQNRRKKLDMLKQFDPNLREQLKSNLTWQIINYNPLRFYVSYKENKQIILASVKTSKIENYDPNTNLSQTIEIHSLNPTKVIIQGVPVEILKHQDPLGILTETRYTIRFETSIEQQNTFTIGPKTLDEILQELHDRALITDQSRAIGAFSSIILAMEKENKVSVNRDIITPGFYFIENQIRCYHTNHPEPTGEEISRCIKTLELLKEKFKNNKIFPTTLKWSIFAPFNFVMKQKNRKCIPWVYLYGFPNTGKSTLGDISKAIWSHYNDENFKIPYTNIDTVAKLGESVSKSTYPVTINEVGVLSSINESRFSNRNMLEMLKTVIESTIARSNS